MEKLLMLRVEVHDIIDILRRAGRDGSRRIRGWNDPLGDLADHFEIRRGKRLGLVSGQGRLLLRPGGRMDVLPVKIVGGKREGASRPDRTDNSQRFPSR